MKYDEFLGFAEETAIAAGRLIRDMAAMAFEIRHKGVGDLVTETDLASEKFIKDTILNEFPGHSILAEESGLAQKDSDHLWIIDPLDGTTNYAHRFPMFTVSIALAVQGTVVCGAIYEPNADELFSAAVDSGATLNGKKISVSTTVSLLDSLLITGVPNTVRDDAGLVFKRFEAASKNAQGVRRCGSAALDLCYVACGRADGFFEEGLKPWDTAAGALIAGEAGAVISKYDGSPFDIYHPEIIAANGLINRELTGILNDFN